MLLPDLVMSGHRQRLIICQRVCTAVKLLFTAFTLISHAVSSVDTVTLRCIYDCQAKATNELFCDPGPCSCFRVSALCMCHFSCNFHMLTTAIMNIAMSHGFAGCPQARSGCLEKAQAYHTRNQDHIQGRQRPQVCASTQACRHRFDTGHVAEVRPQTLADVLPVTQLCPRT